MHILSKPEDIPGALLLLLLLYLLLLVLLLHLLILHPASLLCRLLPLHHCLSRQHVDKARLVDGLQHLKGCLLLLYVNFHQINVFNERQTLFSVHQLGEMSWEN